MARTFDPRLSVVTNPQVPEVVTVDFKGIYDYPNQFSPQSLPQGALVEATNCVLESPGRIDSRRGYGIYGNTSGTPSQGLWMAAYNGGRLFHADDNRLYKDNNAGHFQSITSTQYFVPGSYAGSRIRFVEQNGNLFFNSNTGIYKLQSLNTTPVLAGGPQALGGNVTAVTLPAGGGPLPNASSVAYRALWEYTDQNNNLIRGVPSTPLVANNNSSTNNAQCQLTFTIPTSVDTSWTFRVYRSNYGINPAPPDDNCQLVYSVQPNAAQITARTITFTDNVADTQRGETLYTTAQGIANAEYRPPIAQDLALYKGSMFYGNCKTYQQLLLTLQTDGVLQTNDNLSFWQGTTLLFAVKAAASENAAAGQFKVFSGQGATIDIDQTSQSLCNVINYYANNSTVDAYYQSVINVSQPGQMLFQLRAYNDNPFYITCSNTSSAALFDRSIPSTGNNVNNLSVNTNNQHYVYYSKSLQPEAVPLNYWFAVGSKLTAVKRLVPMRDTLVVIKDDGLYAITGNDPTTFTVYPMDIQQNLAGVNTPAVLNNILYFLGQQGLVEMDQYGNHQIVSLPIQQTLMQLTTNVYPNFASASWAVAYQAAHKYILFTVASASDTTAQQAFVYDWTTKAWTMWDRPFTCGVVDPVIGTLWATKFVSSNCQIYQERKNLDVTDYADEEYQVILTGVTNSNVLSVTTVPTQAAAGQTLYQPPYISLISAVDSVNNKITVTNDYAWNVNSGPANVCIPIAVTIETTPIYGNDPTQVKQFPEFSMIVDGTTAATFNVSLISESSTSNVIELSVPATQGSAYGVGIYGTGPYGGASVISVPSRLRSYVPMAVQKCNWLQFLLASNTAFERVALSGLQLVYRPLSTRQR